ncbi:MAG: MGMT family protein [Planctomycetota bacterium]|nr:MGMT family protein [Planctomycetota bacterium]
MKSKGNYARIYAMVKRVPKGRVTTYGQIAARAGLAGHARQVGYALAALEDDSIPWYRVINAKGEISPRTWGDSHVTQRDLLEDEGVEFNETGRISLARFQWKPKAKCP